MLDPTKMKAAAPASHSSQVSQYLQRHLLYPRAIFLFAEQQYRGYKRCPMNGTSPLQDMAAAISHTNPEKRTTALAGMMVLLLQTVSTLPNAVQESMGEAILVRPQKPGWRTACALPSPLPQPRAARWAQQCEDRSWAQPILL